MGGKAVRRDADHAAGAGRQAGRDGNRPRPAATVKVPSGQATSRHMAYLTPLPRTRARAPHKQGRQEGQRRPAENLQQQVRRHRAQRAQPVGGVAQIGVVQAGIVGGIADQREPAPPLPPAAEPAPRRARPRRASAGSWRIWRRPGRRSWRRPWRGDGRRRRSFCCQPYVCLSQVRASWRGETSGRQLENFSQSLECGHNG